jgi:chemotaxis methyl-accepting protein methylase
MNPPPSLPSDARVEVVLRALEAKHGIDRNSGAVMRERVRQLLLELETARAADDDPPSDALLERVAAAVRVGETRFFRDGTQLEALAREILPRVGAGRFRALSAGCATGEEAYTLAMLCEEARLAASSSAEARWDVVGVDALPASVSIARGARYPAAALAAIPARLRRFVEDRGGELAIAPAIAARCSFAVGDLMTASLGGPYDLVLCRNVLIYLADDAVQRVLRRLTASLARRGVLVVARAEAQLARRAGLVPISLGSPPVTVFRVTPPSHARLPRVTPPPSSPSLVVEGAPAEVARRGQALLAGRVAGERIAIDVAGDVDDLEPYAIALRRFAAAVRAVGATCVAGSPRAEALLRGLHVVD